MQFLVLAVALLAHNGLAYSVDQMSALRDGSEAAVNAVNAMEKARDMAKTLLVDRNLAKSLLAASTGSRMDFAEGRQLNGTVDPSDFSNAAEDLITAAQDLVTCLNASRCALMDALADMTISFNPNSTLTIPTEVTDALCAMTSCLATFMNAQLSILGDLIDDLDNVSIINIILSLLGLGSLSSLLSGGLLGGLLGGVGGSGGLGGLGGLLGR